MNLGQLPIIEKINDEAVALLVDARDYAASSCRNETVPPNERSRIIGEKFRVTSRLASVVAWVMYRKAVVSGEIEEEDALGSLEGPDGNTSRLGRTPDTRRYIPARLLDLLERSHQLWVQVARLDKMIRKKPVDEARQ